MLRDDRRMQEGARDLAIAFNIGRAEEALSRLTHGSALREQDFKFFRLVADFFTEALKGFRWVESALAGESAPVSADSLTAFQLLLPALEAQTSPITFLSELIKVSTAMVTAEPVSDEQRSTLSSVLKTLSISAARQGMDSLEPKTKPSSFSILPKVQ